MGEQRARDAASQAATQFWFTSLDDLGLLMADLPWDGFLAALREATGETYEVGAPVPDAWAWLDHPPSTGAWQVAPVLGGSLEGRSYLLSGNLLLGATADRVAMLAERTGATVLGYSFQDDGPFEMLTVARGASVVRYIVEMGDFGRHEEGDPLRGEEENRAIAWIDRLGFDVDAWLERGRKHEIRWTMLTSDVNPEKHARLYLGPLRMRVEYLHQAVLHEVLDGDADEQE